MALRFVSREGWGAKPPKSVTKRAPSELAGVAVHWFGSPRAAQSHDDCIRLLQGVQRTHMAPGGLGAAGGGADIAYNHAVCPHGKAFTLRGFGVQTGANGDAKSNRDFAAVVYMGGGDARSHDTPTEEALPVLAEVIRMWQAKGAGPLVKPHQFFTGSDCPGPDLLDWVARMPPPWAAPDAGQGGGGVQPPADDGTPPWLIDFIIWRLGENADPKQRPKDVPARVPKSAWEATAQIHRMVGLMGPQDAFLDWVEWRSKGADKATRPRSVPAEIPAAWKKSLRRLEKSLKSAAPA